MFRSKYLPRVMDAIKGYISKPGPVANMSNLRIGERETLAIIAQLGLPVRDANDFVARISNFVERVEKVSHQSDEIRAASKNALAEQFLRTQAVTALTIKVHQLQSELSEVRPLRADPISLSAIAAVEQELFDLSSAIWANSGSLSKITRNELEQLAMRCRGVQKTIDALKQSPHESEKRKWPSGRHILVDVVVAVAAITATVAIEIYLTRDHGSMAHPVGMHSPMPEPPATGHGAIAP